MSRKKTVPELKVLFDTNALYTQSASELVKPDIAQLVKENSSHVDHKISWYLPSIVRHERQYQMLKAGKLLLPAIHKLEKLLGHNLGMSEAILEDRVKHAVESQLHELKLNIVEINASDVNWAQIMHSAVYRLPPFDPGEKEKGFRDALVIESLQQLIAQSPVTPKVCRVVLVSEDKLVREAAKAATAATAACTNVRVLNTLEEVKGYINTLVSEVDEAFVEEILSKVQPYFFVRKEESSLFYKEQLRNKIEEQFSQELTTKPEGVTEIEANTWYVGAPRFTKKELQRFFWTTRITATFTGYDVTNKFDFQGLMSSAAAIPEKKVVMKYGVYFEVDWSVTLGQHKKLSSPKIEDIRYIETEPREEN